MDEKKYVSKKRKRTDSLGPSSKRSRTKYTKFLLPSSKMESKSLDLSSGSANLTFTTAIGQALANACIAGNAIQNRLGRRIRMRNLRIMGHIYQNQAGAVPGDDFCHVYVVYDYQPNGAAFALADFLQSCDVNGTTGSNSLSGINMSNSKRFKVLRHQIYKFENATGASLNQPAQVSDDRLQRTIVDWFIPLKGLETQYNTGNAGAINDIQTGALYIVTLGSQSQANAQYSMTFNSRLRFDDM